MARKEIVARKDRSAACPETSSDPRAGEEHQPRIVRRAELPVDGQAQDGAVEAAAPVQVGWAQ